MQESNKENKEKKEKKENKESLIMLIYGQNLSNIGIEVKKKGIKPLFAYSTKGAEHCIENNKVDMLLMRKEEKEKQSLLDLAKKKNIPVEYLND